METPQHGRRSNGAAPVEEEAAPEFYENRRHGRRAAEKPTDAARGGWLRAPRHAAPSAPLPFPPLPTGVGLPANTDPLELAPILLGVTHPPIPGGRRFGRKKTRTLTAAVVTTGSLAVIAAGTSFAIPSVPKVELEEDAEIVMADSSAVLTMPRVEVSTVAAPYVAVVRKTQVPAPVVLLPVVVKPAVAAPAPAAPVTPPVVAAPPPVHDSPAAAIAAAALAQLGVFQDCTMLVTNSLRAAGISFHGWPAGYLSLGTIVAPAQAMAGDLAYYVNGGAGVAHIAVYIGNGQAVHGGFNGNQTKIFSVNVGSGPVFIRVT